MFDKKIYYISSFSLRNRYCFKKELHTTSIYERQILAIDEYNNEYVILFERIGNHLPNVKSIMFELPINKEVVYPVDLITKSNIYVYENEIGFVYPTSFLDYNSIDDTFTGRDKVGKAKILYQLCCVVKDVHKSGFLLSGIDKKQLMIKSDEIKIRYNGFRIHNRNSIYRVPDYFANKYSSKLYMLDVFSLVAIIFETMYGCNPFCGMMTSFTSDEEYRFEVFYNNFRKKIFIFETDKKLNQIGFLIEHRSIIDKWSETDQQIRDFFNHILTMEIPEHYTYDFVFEQIFKVIDYYLKAEVF